MVTWQNILLQHEQKIMHCKSYQCIIENEYKLLKNNIVKEKTTAWVTKRRVAVAVFLTDKDISLKKSQVKDITQKVIRRGNVCDNWT